MVVDRDVTDKQLLGNLFILHSLAHKCNDIPFPLAQSGYLDLVGSSHGRLFL